MILACILCNLEAASSVMGVLRRFVTVTLDNPLAAAALFDCSLLRISNGSVQTDLL